jgi:DMSO reductase anchor subunit
MCHGRLSEGEAPACAQACPNGAISIGIVDTVVLEATAAFGGSLVPGAPASSITIPSTEYRTATGRVADVLAADRFAIRPGHAHDPLAVMLVLTQLAVGAFLADLLHPAGHGDWGSAVALFTGVLALGASIFHLGRPQYAWRAVIGLRHSWLSREVVAFGAFAALAAPYALFQWQLLGAVVAFAGVAGVACSVLLYARTRRRWWRTSATAFRFGMTTVICGCAVAAATSGDRSLAVASAGAAALKVVWELVVLRHLRAPADDDLHKTAQLLVGPLSRWLRWRIALTAVGVAVLPLLALAALPFLVVGELLERRLFFTASVAPRMPGVG